MEEEKTVKDLNDQTASANNTSVDEVAAVVDHEKEAEAVDEEAAETEEDKIFNDKGKWRKAIAEAGIEEEYQSINKKHTKYVSIIENNCFELLEYIGLNMSTVPICLKVIMASKDYVEECKEELNSIKEKLGPTSWIYLRLGSLTANRPVHHTDKAVEIVQKVLLQVPSPKVFKGVMEHALATMEAVGTLDMDSLVKNDYERIYSKLKDISAGKKKNRKHTDGSSESKGGWFRSAIDAFKRWLRGD